VKFGAGTVTLFDNGYTLVYGAGTAYRFNERYALRVAYDYFDFGVDQNDDTVADKKLKVGYIYAAFEVQF